MKFIRKNKINEWVDTENVDDNILNADDKTILNNISNATLDAYKNKILSVIDQNYFKHYCSSIATEYGLPSIIDYVNLTLELDDSIVKINVYAHVKSVYLSWFHTNQNFNINRLPIHLTDTNIDEIIIGEEILLKNICKQLNLDSKKFSLKIYFVYDSCELSQKSYNAGLYFSLKRTSNQITFYDIVYIINSLIFLPEDKPNSLILSSENTTPTFIKDFYTGKQLRYKFSNICFLKCPMYIEKFSLDGIENVLDINAEYVNIFFDRCTGFYDLQIKSLLKKLNYDKCNSIYLNGNSAYLASETKILKSYLKNLKIWNTDKCDEFELNKWYHTHNIFH